MMDIHESLNAILPRGSQFAEGFYQRFDREHPQIFRHFDGMNMKMQAHLLTTALILVVRDFEKNTESIKEYLRVLGTRHHHRRIVKSDFAAWEVTLRAALAEFHAAEWSAELDEQWRSALSKAIGQIYLGYDERHSI
jgi:hemoglobin-like flavoprotein